MPDRTDSSPTVAFARTWAIYKSTVDLNQRTGGDPAEAVYEMLTAAMLLLLTQRPMKPPCEIFADIAPLAETTARDWFAAEIAKAKNADH